MPRAATVTLLVVGVVPWLYLLLVQAFAAYLTLAVGGELSQCFDNGALPSAALLWLAIAPLPLGICALARRARALGLGLLGIGFPLIILSVDKGSCPAETTRFDDADGPTVFVDVWTLLAYLLVLACFGLVMLRARRT